MLVTCGPPPLAVLGKLQASPLRLGAALSLQMVHTSCLSSRGGVAAQAKHRYALLVKVRREWEVGRRVNSLLNPERAMPGYMGTGRGVVMANGHFQGASLQCLSLLG